MIEIRLTTRYKKDLKKAKKNPRQDTVRLIDAIEILAETQVLPDEYKPHPLIGNFLPKWECHIQPDFLLIYEILDNVLYLHRCGSHSELFSK